MPKTWTVSCTARQYEWLRTEEAFAAIASLARSVNQVRFATHGPFALEGEDSTPFVARQMTSAIMSAGPTLFEGVKLARKHLRRHFSQRSITVRLRRHGRIPITRYCWIGTCPSFGTKPFPTLTRARFDSLRNPALLHSPTPDASWREIPQGVVSVGSTGASTRIDASSHGDDGLEFEVEIMRGAGHR